MPRFIPNFDVFWFYVGFEDFFPMTGILALILGIIALIKIRNEKGKADTITKINVIISSLILAFWLISGLLYASSFILLGISEDLSNNPKYIFLCNTIRGDELQDRLGRDYCYRSVAEEKKDYLICEKINEGDIKGECYGRVALVKKDNTICEKSSGVFARDISNNISTKDLCYNYVATAIKDVSLCDNIKNVEFRDECYIIHVSENPDASTCAKIETSYLKNDCYITLAETE